MSYAIVESGGKQYKAVEGGLLEVDLLAEEIGKKITLSKVLLLSDEVGTRVGTPFLPGVSVEATVVEHFKGPKIIVFNYRAKQRYRVKTGHRQQYSRLKVNSIAYEGKPKAAKKEESKSISAPEKTAKAEVKKATKVEAKKPVKVTKKAAPATKKSTSKKADKK